MAMDTKDIIRAESVLTSPINDGNVSYNQSSTALQPKKNKSYQDIGSNSLGKVEPLSTRPCAIIGPDRVLPPPPASDVYLKKASVEPWSCNENVYLPQTDFAPKLPEYQQVRNISPRQTFQENMQRIMVPPTYNSDKNIEDPNLKGSKDTPLEVKYCEVPYPVNPMINGQKSIRNSDVPMTSVNPAFSRTVPPHGWPNSVSARPLRPFGAAEYYQYPEFVNYTHPRTIPRPPRTAHHVPAQVNAEHLYHEGNVRFKPYPTVKDRFPQARYDYGNNYPSQFHSHGPFPSQKFDLPKTVPPHPYPMFSQVPMRRIAEPIIDSYQRPNQPANFNPYHNQYIPPPYGPVSGNCIQNKMYSHPSELSSKPLTGSKLPYNLNNKIYLDYENNINKIYPPVDNNYYRDLNRQHLSKTDVAIPVHPGINMPYNIPPQYLYRKDNIPMKTFENITYRSIDQNIHANSALLRHPLQYSSSGFVISPADSNASNEALTTLGNLQEDCGYVSQSSTASGRSIDSGNYRLQSEILRKNESFYKSNMKKYSKQVSRSDNSDKKGLNVRQFLQMWNEGEEEVADSINSSANNFSTNSETISNQEQLYVLGLVNIPSEELSKYEHIQKISKLPENIKGYNSIELLDQYEQLVESPALKQQSKMNTLIDYQISPKAVAKPTLQVPRPVSPLDVEAKISQSVIHKEVGCNFEIKPCSPKMLNAEVPTPAQNILDGRSIEKVINLGLINSSLHTNKPDNITSCKMNSPYVSNSDVMNSNNYSFQELESNSSICLASLPRLDSDIELNFPEINQQFIDANKFNTNTNNDNMDIALTNIVTKTDVPEYNVEKETSKLSKYRKNKIADSSDDNIHSCIVNRTDSVIIKNPDNIRNQEEIITGIATEINERNTRLHTPEASYGGFISTDSFDNNEENVALDFSLNKITDNHKIQTECNNLPDLNSKLELQKSESDTNVSIDNVYSKDGSNDSNETNNNHEHTLGSVLKSSKDINLEYIPEVRYNKNDYLHAPVEINTKNNDDIFENENIAKDTEDNLKCIEEEVENIKLKLPSLCGDSIARKHEIKELTDDGSYKYTKESKGIETESGTSKEVTPMISVTNSCNAKDDYLTTHQKTIQKNNVSEASVVHEILEESDIFAERESDKDAGLNDHLERIRPLTEEITATEKPSSLNDLNTEINAMPEITDVLMIQEQNEKIQTESSEHIDVKDVGAYNVNVSADQLIAKTNEKNDESFTLKSPNGTPIYDHATVINNNHIIDTDDNLKQDNLIETSEKDMKSVQDNYEETVMSPINMKDNESLSSTCSPQTENLPTESSDNIFALPENINKFTEAGNISEDHNMIEKEPLNIGSDCAENTSSQMLEIQVFIEEIKADMSSPILDIEPDVELVPELICENNDENDEIQTSSIISRVPTKQKYFYKEYYSPRLQSLYLYSEGKCWSATKLDVTINDRLHNIDSNKVEDELIEKPILEENTIQSSLILSPIDTKVLESIDEIQIPEISCVVEAESDDNLTEKFNTDEIETVDDKIFQSDEVFYIQQDQSSNHSINIDSLTKNCDEETVESSLLVNKRFTLKRSLSDSAIKNYNSSCTEEYSDVNKEFLCKKQKIISNEDSDQDRDDFCSIVQNNRRNSISICNSQNVFILIDNEYVIEEDDEECSEKICFTELSNEFCSETDTTLNVCVANDSEEELIPEVNTSDSPETSDHSQENKTTHDAWDMDCVETIFNDDVAEDIIISAPTSPGNLSLDPNDEDGSENSESESEHILRIKEIYSDTMSADNVKLVETLYNTPQIDLNRTLVEIESQNIQDTVQDPTFSEPEDTEDAPFKNIYFKNKVKQLNEIEIKNKTPEVECNILNLNELENKHQDFQYNDCNEVSGAFRNTEYVAYNNKENDLNDSPPSSPEVSSTTSEEKCSSILLKITSVNGSRTSQINNIVDNSKRASYKLTEVQEYSANYRPLITKAAKKYIPPLKESQDLRVKLPLPQQSLDKLKRLKITKNKTVLENTNHRGNHIRHDVPKKIKPKFEDVLRSIDEIQFKMKREKTKKMKQSIPKVVIKKNQNGAHYASTPDRKPNYNPDLTGRKWQPWVFMERNDFVDKMAQRNKVKAVYCHRKKTYILAENFKKYKSICTAKFVISQPNSGSASTGNLKYTIKLKHNY